MFWAKVTRICQSDKQHPAGVSAKNHYFCTLYQLNGNYEEDISRIQAAQPA
jgi:hypothetical protein